jgi:hypothetical protein
MGQKFDYIANRETGETAYIIKEGKFDGVIYTYTDIQLPELDGDSAEEIPVKFTYHVLKNPTDEDLVENVEFGNVIGEIMLEILDDALANDTVNYENRNDNTEQLNS